MSDEIPWLPRIGFPRDFPFKFREPDTIRKILEHHARCAEEMVLAMRLVQRPEWRIVRIQCSQFWGFAFVPEIDLNLPSFMEIVKDPEQFIMKTKADIGTRIRNFKFEENKMFETHTTTDTRVEDPVNHPSHYTNGPALGRLECLDITRWLPFDLGNAFKYIWRAGIKDATKMVEDLQKARFYLLDWKDLQTWQKTLYHGRAAAETLFFKTDYRQWESWRYRALRSILCGNVEDAINIIEHQLNALEAAEAEAEAERQSNSGCPYEPEDETDED